MANGMKVLNWFIEINNEVSDDALMVYVTSVVFNATRERMSKLTISVFSPWVKDNAKTQYIFAKGRDVTVFANYGGRPTFLGAGVIESHEMDCGGQNLQVICLDKGSLMGIEERDETYPNTTDSAIAEKVAKRYSLQTDVEATKGKLSRTQSRKTDYAFLRDLAGRNGYEFFVDFDVFKRKWVLHFRKPKPIEQKTATVYDFGGPDSLMRSFSPQVSGKLKKEAKVKVHAWLRDARKAEVLEEKVLGEGTVEELFDLEFHNKEEATAFIKSLAKKRDDLYFTATAQVLGNPTLKIGQVHTFKGLTFKYFPSLDGDFRINEVTHSLTQDTFYTDLALYRVEA